jgi:hypothetical protein
MINVKGKGKILTYTQSSETITLKTCTRTLHVVPSGKVQENSDKLFQFDFLSFNMKILKPGKNIKLSPPIRTTGDMSGFQP